MKINKDYMTVMRVGRAAHKAQARRSYRREIESVWTLAWTLIAAIVLGALALLF